NNYWNDFGKKIVAALKPSIDMIERIKKNISESFQQRLQQVNSIIASSLSRYFNYAQEFSKYINTIKFPSISKERQEELNQSFIHWGELGWTVMPDAPINIFYSCPDDIVAANKIAMQYCRPKNIDNLFEYLRKENIRKADLDEAIFCFKNHQYKACALVLSGIIDSKLIKKQPKPQKKGEKRPTGKTAVDNLKDKFEKQNDVEKMFFIPLVVYNLTAFLISFFKYGNDFRSEPDIINRHYIAHGMNVRCVRKRDCIQLFLALYNLIEWLKLFD
ncbi:MAG: hypothetical protein DIU81_005715, partial [[Clostridium] cellulosi]